MKEQGVSSARDAGAGSAKRAWWRSRECQARVMKEQGVSNARRDDALWSKIGKNTELIAIQLFIVPRAREWAKRAQRSARAKRVVRCERTSEWPNTSVRILGSSGPQCGGSDGVTAVVMVVVVVVVVTFKWKKCVYESNIPIESFSSCLFINLYCW